MNGRTQQHHQDDGRRSAEKGDNPFRLGDVVALNAVAAGKWPKRRGELGCVVEEPGRYMVAVQWGKRIDLLHFVWLKLVDRPGPNGEAFRDGGRS